MGLDQILNTNLKDKVLNELSDYMNNNRNVYSYKTESIDMSNLNILSRIQKCFDSITIESVAIKDDLYKNDKLNSANFYRTNYIHKYKVDKAILSDHQMRNSIGTRGRKIANEEQDDGR